MDASAQAHAVEALEQLTESTAEAPTVPEPVAVDLLPGPPRTAGDDEEPEADVPPLGPLEPDDRIRPAIRGTTDETGAGGFSSRSWYYPPWHG
jgi:hypothetical protein